MIPVGHRTDAPEMFECLSLLQAEPPMVMSHPVTQPYKAGNFSLCPPASRSSGRAHLQDSHLFPPLHTQLVFPLITIFSAHAIPGNVPGWLFLNSMKHTFCQSSFMAVVFYKVTGNAQLANTKPLLPGETRVRLLRASDHTFANWSRCNLVLHVLPFKDAFHNIYCWFINTELAAPSATAHAWTKLIQHFSCVRHNTAFLRLGTGVGMAARNWPTILNREMANKKH